MAGAEAIARPLDEHGWTDEHDERRDARWNVAPSADPCPAVPARLAQRAALRCATPTPSANHPPFGRGVRSMGLQAAAVARVPRRGRGCRGRLRAHDGAGRPQALRRGRGRGHAQGDGHAAMRGTVVIGEGERDEAPMLYIGEKVGAWARRRSGGRHRRRPARGHQPVRHRLAERHRRAGGVEQGRPAERARLLHGEDHRRAGGQGRRAPRRDGEGEPQGDRHPARPRRSATWW